MNEILDVRRIIKQIVLKKHRGNINFTKVHLHSILNSIKSSENKTQKEDVISLPSFSDSDIWHPDMNDPSKNEQIVSLPTQNDQLKMHFISPENNTLFIPITSKICENSTIRITSNICENIPQVCVTHIYK